MQQPPEVAELSVFAKMFCCDNSVESLFLCVGIASSVRNVMNTFEHHVSDFRLESILHVQS